MLFWTKQAFYTSVFLFGCAVLVPYLGHVLNWLYLIAFITLTWFYYNQPVDETRTLSNRYQDLRPVFVGVGVIIFSLGYFGISGPSMMQNAIAFGLGAAFLPMIAVEACRLKEAQKKKDGGTTMFIFFFWPLFTSVIAIVTFYSKMFEATLVVSIVGQSIQWVLALVLDHGEYAKKHRSPFVRS